MAPTIALLAICGGIFATLPEARTMFVWDEAEYATLGRSVLRGEGFSIGGKPNRLRPPVLPLAAAVSMAVTGRTDDRAARLAQGVLCVAGVAAVVASAGLLVGSWGGCLAGFFLAIAPFFVGSARGFLSENAFMGPFAGAALCFFAALERDERWFVPAAGLFALALLTRYTGLLFFPIALLAVAVHTGGRRRALVAVARKLGSRWSLIGVAVAASLLAPWFIRQHLAFGDALVGIKEASTQLQVYVTSVSMPWHTYPVSLPPMLSAPTLLLAVLGLVVGLRRRDRPALFCGLAALFLIVWFSVYRYKEPRLVSAVLPFLGVLAAQGALALPWRRLRAARTFVVAVLLGGLAALNLAQAHAELTRTIAIGYPSFLEAMAFVRAHSAPGDLVLGPNTPQIAWYADRRVENLPRHEAALGEALTRSAWLVGTNFERGQRDYLGPLIARLGPTMARDDARAFQDRRFRTFVLRSSAVAARLTPEAPPGPGPDPDR